MSNTHDEHLIKESKKISHALGLMFAPFCEVVLHDLRSPDRSILLIENNFSGRKHGDSTTTIGLERATNPNFPEVLQNYRNILPDGKILKSTSIGIKNETGQFIASICLNFDISFFNQFFSGLRTFTETETLTQTPSEQLRTLSIQELTKAVTQFAQTKHSTPQSLTKTQRVELLSLLEKNGLLQLRNSITNLANLLGVTRPTIYSYLKTKP